MNLFFLHCNPSECAKHHCDKHVVKMILEIVQMLYTAHIVLGTENLPEGHYRKISNHIHPTAVWIRKCKQNYLYAAEVALSIAYEYTHRYNKIHSCQSHAEWLFQNLPVFNEFQDYSGSKKKIVFATNDFFISLGITPIPLCMPDDCYCDDPIKSYRKYYLMYKKHFVKWTSRGIPFWFYFFDIRKIIDNYK
jgi:hypothetical protein